VAAEVAVAALPSYYKITYCKLWPAVEVGAAARVIKAVVVIVPDHTVRLMLDTTAKQAQVIQPTAAVAVVEVVDTMAAPVAAATAAHMVDIQVQATLAGKQEILVPAGVLNIQMGLHPMAEHPVGCQALLCQIMWDWVDRLVVPAAMAI
jgi:hypothetical protein